MKTTSAGRSIRATCITGDCNNGIVESHPFPLPKGWWGSRLAQVDLWMQTHAQMHEGHDSFWVEDVTWKRQIIDHHPDQLLLADDPNYSIIHLGGDQ